MSRELLKLKNIGKLVPKSYRDCREYRWKQSWSKRSSNIALFSPSKEQTCRLMAEASSEKANSHAGKPWWFYTGSRPDSRQKTLLTDRLSSMSRFVSHQGIWRFQFQAFFGTKENWNCCEEVCSKKLLKRILFCTHWIKTLQVRGVDQTPCPIVYCMELRWRQPCSDE